MWPLKSLSLKITFSVLFAVLLIFAAILFYNYHISRDLLLKNVESNVKNLAYGKALRIEKLLESSAKIPENMSFILESSDYSKEELQELLELIVANNEELFGSCIAYEPFAFDPDSMFFAPYVFRSAEGVSFKYLNAESLNYFEWDWYRLPRESKQACWTEPYFDEGGGEVLMCTYSVPFFANKQDKEIKGVVTIDISLEWLKDYVESIKVYEKGYAFLISGQGSVITHPVEDLSTNQNIFQVAEERGYDVLARAAEDMVGGGSDFIPYDSPLVSGKSWLYYTPLKATGWSLAIILPEEEFTADLYKLNRDLLLIGIAGFIILFLIVIIISRKITKPLTVLAVAAREIGGGNFEAMLPESKSKDEIGALNASIRSMQTELKTYIRNLRETTAAKEKIESELQIARDIQQSIIPHIFPPFPENDSVELFAVLNPARDVGGDLYDFFFVDEKHMCFTVGDVSGKGVPASLFMAITRTLLRARLSVNMKASEIMTAMNNELCLENENAMFVTLFLGILNVETGHISYCNAGHNYPFIIKDNGNVVELKGTHGTPLGAMPDIDYGISEIFLDHRDSIMIFTDGISEAIDVNENQYTEKRIIDQLSKMKDSNPEAITKGILTDLDGFVGEADQFDDITMLVIKWLDTAKG
jgi:sigma-B regulation protein RsbU (phosphoserine phosphatase)